MKIYGGMEVMALSFLTLALDGGEWSVSWPVRLSISTIVAKQRLDNTLPPQQRIGGVILCAVRVIAKAIGFSTGSCYNVHFANIITADEIS
jgi:hypothetical protein